MRPDNPENEQKVRILTQAEIVAIRAKYRQENPPKDHVEKFERHHIKGWSLPKLPKIGR